MTQIAPEGEAGDTRPMTEPTTTPTITVRLGADELRDALIADVRRGLGSRPYDLPAHLLYDECGSELFDEITRLPEYYPTEAEREILAREAAAIVELSRADTVIELGSGTSDKTRTLLDAFAEAGSLRRVVAFDVSEETLRDAAAMLAERYPAAEVHAVAGDFNRHLDSLPDGGCRMVVFLGSTIGNLPPTERAAFLTAVRAELAPGDSLLLGVDLVKSVDRLVAAYDDPRGVTEAFSRNVLRMLDRELGADFVPESFEHVAFWDPRHERMDLRLRAVGDQRVSIPDADLDLDLADGEEIRIEVSTKFRADGITSELRAAGFDVERMWTDRADDFAVVLATAGQAASATDG